MNSEFILSKLGSIGPFSALNMKLVEFSETSAVIGISIEGNRNDKNTMFAGSIYSAMVLAGWVLARAASESTCPSHDVVIKESSVRFRLPVRSDCTARAEVSALLKETRSGMFGISVAVRLLDSIENKTCAEFAGTYICLPPPGTL